MICPICKSNKCSCSFITASDGKRICKSCKGSYEASIKVKITNLVELKKPDSGPFSAKKYGYITQRKNLTPEKNGAIFNEIVEI